ncbi:MAG: galactokinase [Planctomycetota bacterium]|jgi:galactokinase|nr:galactokinase [Planctomycetota bacterium]
MKTLEREIGEGSLDAVFDELYSRSGGDASPGRRRWLLLLHRYATLFGGGARPMLFSTPGRTEIGGNHTDHQHGCVLAGSVDLDIIAAAAPTADNVIRIASEGFPEQTIPIEERMEPNPDEYNDSRALVRGIVAQFRERGYAVTGFNACLSSNVLRGSGLSSSAAFEVMIGTMLNHLFAGGAVPDIDICTIARYAENVYFGKPCGLMDQIACCVGGVAFIDFRDIDYPEIARIQTDFRARGYAMCIIDSGADHAAMTDEYSPIPEEMHEVAQCFGKDYLREVDRQEFLLRLPDVRRRAGDRAVMRALHFFADNQRAIDEARALTSDDMSAFLRLVNESGRSSHMYLQNVFPSGSSRHQAVGLSLALCDEFLGGEGAFRVHGGGFAGTVQAFVPLDMLDGFRERIERVLGAGTCHVLAIRNRGSIRVG